MFGGLFGRTHNAAAPGTAGQRQSPFNLRNIAAVIGSTMATGSPEAGLGIVDKRRTADKEMAKRNKTLEAARRLAPEYADLFEAGLLSGPELGKAVLEAQKPKKATEFTQLSPEEVKAMGLPEGNYQMGPNKKIFPIGGGGTSISLDADGNLTFNQGGTVQSGRHSGQLAKSLSKADAKQLEAVREGAEAAEKMQETARVVKGLHNKVGYTGPGGEAVGMADDLIGILPGDKGARGAFKQASMDMVLALIQQTKGAISNRENEMFQAASAGMGKTPEANLNIANVTGAVASRLRMKNAFYEDYLAANGSLHKASHMWDLYKEENQILDMDQEGNFTVKESPSYENYLTPSDRPVPTWDGYEPDEQKTPQPDIQLQLPPLPPAPAGSTSWPTADEWSAMTNEQRALFQ